MSAGIRAVVFDLYGTLLDIEQRLLGREVPRVLGGAPRRWVSLVRDHILTRPFSDRAELARFVASSLCPEAPNRAEALLPMIDRELASVRLADGALSLLAFLQRRGYALALASNLSSIHKEPVERLGLLPFFSTLLFSCDLGFSKPDPRVYEEACRRLGVAPEEALMVGDHPVADVSAPREHGMHAILLGDTDNGSGVRRLAHVGWLCLEADRECQRLLAEGQRLELDGVEGKLRELNPLPDAQQGRFNLVATARFEPDDPHRPPLEVFCKRFLHPEAAHVEELGHAVHRAVGLPGCLATVAPGPEPCLVVTRAPGVDLDHPTTPELAFEIGRHAATAYIFANGDLRPRNAVVSFDGSRPSITMIDLEFLFFNQAVDLTGLAKPIRSEDLESLSEQEWQRRVKKRVLTSWTMRRARRAFFEIKGPDCPLARAFRDGWIEMYRRAQAETDAVCGLIERRLAQGPPLVLGTRAYRRPMVRWDLADIRRRLGQDAEEVYSIGFESEGATVVL